MLKRCAWVMAGAVLATAGVAHAQEGVGLQLRATEADAPWYQRFTTSSGITESITGVTENDRLMPPAWSLNQHWGVTVDVREATRVERLPEAGRGDQTALGAFYQFTPRVRVGGQVSVETSRPLNAPAALEQGQEPAAGVRIESAFRF